MINRFSFNPKSPAPISRNNSKMIKAVITQEPVMTLTWNVNHNLTLKVVIQRKKYWYQRIVGKLRHRCHCSELQLIFDWFTQEKVLTHSSQYCFKNILLLPENAQFSVGYFAIKNISETTHVSVCTYQILSL